MSSVLPAASPRILIVRVGAMGDVLHAMPAVSTLREVLPQAYIGWAVEPRWAPLLRVRNATERDPERMPLVNAVHPVEAKKWNRDPVSLSTARSIAELRRELRAERYDLAIDLQGTLRSAVIARLSGAARVAGSATPRESVTRGFYSLRVPVQREHVVEQAMEVVRAAAALSPGDDSLAKLSDAVRAPLLPHDKDAEIWWGDRRRQLCENRPPVLLAATAGWGAKEWPPQQFAELAARLVETGHCVLLNTAAGLEDKVTAEVLGRVKERHPEAARHVHALPAHLPELIAASREMHAVIAGDTGPLHLADALGIPTVGLFGPTDCRRTGPRGGICLRDASSRTDHRRHPETETGLSRISVALVMDAFSRITGEVAGRRPD